jgi:hypothetical protein
MPATAHTADDRHMTSTLARPRPGPTGLTWSRTTRRVLLLAHVLTSVGWWGGAVVAAVFAGVAATTADAALAAGLLRSIGVLVWVTVTAGLLSGATGVALGLGTRWGLLRYRWVVLKEAIAAVMLVTDVLVLRPDAAKVLAGTQPAAALLGPAMGHVLFLAAATFLSMFKPWSRPRP